MQSYYFSKYSSMNEIDFEGIYSEKFYTPTNNGWGT